MGPELEKLAKQYDFYLHRQPIDVNNFTAQFKKENIKFGPNDDKGILGVDDFNQPGVVFIGSSDKNTVQNIFNEISKNTKATSSGVQESGKYFYASINVSKK